MPEQGNLGFPTPQQAMYWRGPWSSVLSYRPGDVVRYTSSALYIAVVPNQNAVPTGSQWALLAQA